MERRFAPDEDAPRAARALVTECASGLDDTAAANLYLAVSELVTNAVVHGPGQAITVRCARHANKVRLEVCDLGTTGFDWPEGSAADGERPHGLEVVEAFTDRHGVEIAHYTVVWCELDLDY